MSTTESVIVNDTSIGGSVEDSTTENYREPESFKDVEPLLYSTVVPKRGRGRPRKDELVIAKQRVVGKVGRPKNDRGRMEELKVRLLATGGTRIIDKVVSIAMQDGNPGQMAALKLCLDRILPASVFESAKSGNSVPQISINISSLGSPAPATTTPVIETSDDVVDVDTK